MHFSFNSSYDRSVHFLLDVSKRRYFWCRLRCDRFQRTQEELEKQQEKMGEGENLYWLLCLVLSGGRVCDALPGRVMTVVLACGRILVRVKVIADST